MAKDDAKLHSVKVDKDDAGFTRAQVILDDGRVGEGDGLRWLSFNNEEDVKERAIGDAIADAKSKSKP
jgi:hypothetical protein